MYSTILFSELSNSQARKLALPDFYYSYAKLRIFKIGKLFGQQFLNVEF